MSDVVMTWEQSPKGNDPFVPHILQSRMSFDEDDDDDQDNDSNDNAPHDTQYITRNFAVDLLQHVDMQPADMEHAFVELAQECRECRLPRKELYLTQSELEVFFHRLLTAQAAQNAPRKRRVIDTFATEVYHETSHLLFNLKQKVASLFQAIDIDEANTLKWEQLFWFLIQATMKGRVSGAPEIHTYNVTSKHTVPINEPALSTIQYVPSLGKIMINADKGIRLCESDSPFANYEFIPVAGGKLLCATYIKYHNIVVASCVDLTMRIVDLKLKRERCVMRLDESQLDMVWSTKGKVLYTASRSGCITVWGIKLCRETGRYISDETDPGENANIIIELHALQKWSPHSSPIHRVLILPNDKIVSASLDPAVHVQEPIRGDIVVSCGGAASGLLTLAFSNESGLLLSGGYQREILAWPVTSGKHSPLMLVDKICPHTTPIVGLHAVQDSPQVISCEQSGMVKIWDLRTLLCVQTFTRNALGIRGHVGSDNLFGSMCFVPGEKQLYVAAPKRFVCLSYCHSVDRSVNTVDGSQNTAPAYATESQMLVTGAGRRVRFWHIGNGELCTAHSDLVPENDQISALAIDQSGSAFFVGTQRGYVRSFTTSNGAFICRYSACCGQEVRHLEVITVSASLRYLFGVGWNGKVFVYNLSGTTARIAGMSNPEFPKCVTQGKCTAYNENRLLYAVGTKSVFTLWKISKDPRHGAFTPLLLDTVRCAEASVIGCMCFFDSHPLLAVGVGKGFIQIWIIPTDSQSRKLRLVLQFETPSKTPLSAVTYSSSSKILVVGDEKGVLLCYTVGKIVTAALEVVDKSSTFIRAGRGALFADKFKPTPFAEQRTHDEGFMGLSAYNTPHSIVVASGYDRRIRLFSPWLVPIGFLDPYVIGGSYNISSHTLTDTVHASLIAHEESMVMQEKAATKSTFLTDLPEVDMRGRRTGSVQQVVMEVPDKMPDEDSNAVLPAAVVQFLNEQEVDETNEAIDSNKLGGSRSASRASIFKVNKHRGLASKVQKMIITNRFCGPTKKSRCPAPSLGFRRQTGPDKLAHGENEEDKERTKRRLFKMNNHLKINRLNKAGEGNGTEAKTRCLDRYAHPHTPSPSFLFYSCHIIPNRTDATTACEAT